MLDAMGYNEMRSVLVTVMLWLWSRSLSISPLRTGYIQVQGLSVEALLYTTQLLMSVNVVSLSLPHYRLL